MTVYSLLTFSLTFPLDIINEKQTQWRQRLMVTPFTFTSYYISKSSENYAAICNSDISYFYGWTFL